MIAGMFMILALKSTLNHFSFMHKEIDGALSTAIIIGILLVIHYRRNIAAKFCSGDYGIGNAVAPLAGKGNVIAIFIRALYGILLLTLCVVCSISRS